MARRQFITLRSVKSIEETDMEVPSDSPVSEIISGIIRILNWPMLDENGNQLVYTLTDENGNTLPMDKSLTEAGIDNFSVVRIAMDEAQQRRILDEQKAGPRERIPGKNNNQEDPDLLPKPVPFLLPIDGPCLISEKGVVFMIGAAPALIGRKGKSMTPQVDLSDLDKNLVVSHAHAEITEQNGQYELHTLKPRNGMFLNGTPLAPDSFSPLNDGDQLGFGFNGIQLTWRQPK